MGWWSHTVLGGDPPLDIIAVMEEKLKHYDVEVDLYPTTELRFEDEFHSLKQLLLTTDWKEIFGERGYFTDEITYTVFASVYMAIGIPVPDDLTAKAIQEAQNDEWAESNETRKLYMDAFIDALRNYDASQPMFERTEGLFHKLFDKFGDGKPRWLTIEQLKQEQE